MILSDAFYLAIVAEMGGFCYCYLPERNILCANTESQCYYWICEWYIDKCVMGRAW